MRSNWIYRLNIVTRCVAVEPTDMVTRCRGVHPNNNSNNNNNNNHAAQVELFQPSMLHKLRQLGVSTPTRTR